MKLKGLHFADVAEIQEALTDELKKFQKDEFSVAFQNLYDRTKACIYNNGAYFELKRHVSSSCVFDFLKKICPKTSGTHCVKLNIMLPVNIAGSNTRVASLTPFAVRKKEDLKIFPGCS